VVAKQEYQLKQTNFAQGTLPFIYWAETPLCQKFRASNLQAFDCIFAQYITSYSYGH